ncbi:protein timeless isoform X3 [Palaemon carinicauda]|uniref:protein timeless isoform X3 n=1 Tax=Palaemon carinicauda TaxID=392227 RepID=UPI0035B5BFDE
MSDIPKSRKKKRVRFSLDSSDSEKKDEMEWMVMNMDRFFAPTIQLGYLSTDDQYVATPNCAAKIDEILRRLIQDKGRWHFRRALFMNKIISKNLIPTLISVKEDRGILESTIKVLQELMIPVECLIPINIMGKNTEGFRIISELDHSIATAKEAFLEGKCTKALVDVMNSLLQDSKSLTLEECEIINYCLLLVRNLLHVSSVPNLLESVSTSRGSRTSSSTKTQQGDKEEDHNGVVIEDRIMWNLFAHRFDHVIIQLLTCEQQHLWNITMVQLVSLMYREQQQTTIRKLINEWLELSLAESSEDDENNPMTSSSSDAISTSDPVSDSSERLSPVERTDNNVRNTASAMNSKTNGRQRKSEKEDSCKDSGFGRSGSNMDSSQDDSVSEGAQKNSKESPKSPRHFDSVGVGEVSSEDQLQKDFVDNEFDRKVKARNSKHKKDKSDEDPCNMRMDYKELACDEKSLGECDESVNGEKECDQGGSGSEGGSEGSSPIPVLEQVSPLSSLENEQGDSPLPSFSPNYQQETEALLEDTTDQMLPLAGDMDVAMPLTEIKTCAENVCSPVEQLKQPPKEEESGSSGDSSAKPVPQLPKLHKPMIGQKRSRHAMSQKMLSETQENNESSNSTGSECDEGPHAKRPHHQKPHKMLSKPRPAKMLQKALQEKNLRRNKLLRRKDTSGIKAKALLHHRPKPEDIADLLKEFTIDFMLNGYSNLVQGLRLQVMLPYQIQLDKSHLLWLITYFLRFAVELDLDLGQICPVLSVDVVSYLVYEGVVMQEELEIAVQAGETDLHPHVRRLHLVVTALREFFISLDTCLKKDHNLIDVKHILRIKEEIGELVEVRQLFVLLIRMYRPGVLNLNYLQYLITTNHCFLTTQEATSQFHRSMPSFSIVNHVKQFATMDIMKQYGRLLENFDVNDETVNDCIFTMMHHVAGDLRNVNVLLQPCILRTFLRIWKEGFELCVDWADLIEYILRKCTRVRTENPDGRVNTMFPRPLSEPVAIELTDDDLDQLYTMYKNSSSEQDLMDKIRDICCDDSIEEPIKKEVIQKLLARGFITSSECTKLCAEIQPIQLHAGLQSLFSNTIVSKEMMTVGFPAGLMEPVATKSEGATSLEIDVMQVSSDSDDSLGIIHTSLAQTLEKKKEMFNSSNSDDFKMPPPELPRLGNGNLKIIRPEPPDLESDDLPKLDRVTFRDLQPELPKGEDDDFKMLPPDLPKEVQFDLKEQLDQGTISEKTEGSIEGNMTFTEDSNEWDENGSIVYLIDKLKEEGYSNHIQYLQLQLLEACYSKLKIVGPDIPKPEPVAFHFSLSNQSIPLIPWSVEQEEVFNIAKFRQLLGTLGFHLPSDTGKVYPRIPHFWCPEVLFMVAKKLGPITSSNLRVSVEQMQDMLQKMRALSFTGSLRTHGIQGNEEPGVLAEKTFFDCDDSSERVSDCSMENNRSSTSSPLSSIDEKLIHNEEDDQQSNQFCHRIPSTGSTESSANLTSNNQITTNKSMVLEVQDHEGSTTGLNIPLSIEPLCLVEPCEEETAIEVDNHIISGMEFTNTSTQNPDFKTLMESDDLVNLQPDDTMSEALEIDS